jgi:large exoprotein involved in heme utilization and adhesion
LNANGQVYLINPNGVLFGKGAEVDVGGLVASTLSLSGTPGKATTSFIGTGTGNVVNEGTLDAAPGGTIALLGNHVSNTGVIRAQLGSVVLGAGSVATLTFHGLRLVSMQIDQSVLDNVAANGGLIQADGGQVLMTAGAQKSLLASVVNNTGIIEARTLENHDGFIKLSGGMAAGTVNFAGTLDASAPDGGRGGVIETSAAHVEISNDAIVTTAAGMGLSGTWLIDPVDFTIAASGGDITGATLSNELGSSNIAIQSSSGTHGGTAGNLNVNDAVTWSSHLLTLTATNDVNINAVMTASNTASLDLEPGSGNVNVGISPTGTFLGQVNFFQADGTTPRGGSGFLTIAGLPYTVITTLGADGSVTGTDLQGINGASGGNFALGANIDAAATATFVQGFTPIAGFSGNFNGLGHTISALTLSPAPFTNNVGLFGQTNLNSTIRNVGLINENVTACSSCNSTGGLVGFNYGSITNSFTTGTLTQGHYGQSSGGLVGRNYGSINRSHSSMSITGGDYGTNFGGLVGLDTGPISNSYASGNVTINARDSAQYVGGLVGHIVGTSALIINSYATGAVNVIGYGQQVGGLLGYNDGGTVSNSYATGAVAGNTYVGGLIGQILGRTDNFGNVNNSYATGSVTGSQRVGGLVGGSYGYLNTNNSANISNSYSTGSVTLTGPGPVGGLIGSETPSTGTNSAVTTNSFWDVTKSGQSTSAGGTGLTTAQMEDPANFTSATTANGNVNPGWDFAATWVMYSGHTNPLLQVFMTPLTVITTVAQTYDGAAFAPTISNLDYSIAPDFSHLFGTLTVTGTAVGAIHAGTYSFTPGGLYSDQQGYIIAPFVTGTLTIDPAPITVSNTMVGTKVYDGTTAATLTGGTLVGLIGNDTVTLAQTGAFASKNVGSHIAVSATDSLSGPDAGDYTLVEPIGLTGSITPAMLTVSGTLVGSKVYDGTALAPLSSGTLVGVVSGDTVTLAQTGTFASKNVGSHIAVSATDSLSGADAGDYTLIEPAGLAGSITPAMLTVSGTLVGSRVYDGTTVAPLSGGTLVGVVSGDTVTLTQAGTFASKNAGTGIPVSATDSLRGADAQDYTLLEPTGLIGNITPAMLTVTGTEVGSKVYNGTNAAPLVDGTLVGVVSGDAVTLNQSGTFASTSAGTGIAVTATDSLAGADASDYRIVEPTGLSGTILPAPVKPGGSGSAGGANSVDLIAENARTQIVENFLYPQFGATPQVINAASTIALLPAVAEDADVGAGGDASGTHQAIAVNVSMKIGATGTLKIENGGLRLPGNLTVEKQ